jgi:hypothetical protein
MFSSFLIADIPPLVFDLTPNEIPKFILDLSDVREVKLLCEESIFSINTIIGLINIK